MAVGEIGGINVKIKAEVDATGAVTGFAKISDSAKKIENDFKSVDATAKTAGASITAATNKAAVASQKASRAFKFQKGGMAQLGMQIQDVAVMSQFGADKMIILGTQGSQIASLFGPGGALFGAVLAISAAIGGILVKSIDAASGAAKKLPKELGERLQEIKDRFDEVDEASKSAFLGVEFGKLNQEYDTLTKKIKETEELALMQASALNSTGLEGLTAAKRISKLKAEQEDLANVMNRLSDIATEGLGTTGIDLSIDDGGAIDAGVAERLGIIKSGLAKEKQLLELGRADRKLVLEGILSDEMASARMSFLQSNQAQEAKFASLKTRLEAEKKLLTESKFLEGDELALAQAEIDQAILDADTLKKDGLLTAEELFQQKMQAIRDAAATKQSNLEFAASQSRLRAISGAFSDMASLMNTGSKKMFKIGKAAALAGAIVDGIAAVQGAIKAGNKIGGPPVGAAFGIAAGIQAAVQVRNIAKQEIGGGSATSFSGGLPAVNTQQAAPQQQNTNINLSGINADSLISGGQLVDTLNAALGDGYTINFAGG